MIHIDFIFNSSYLVPGENMKTNILNVSNHIKSCFTYARFENNNRCSLLSALSLLYCQLYHCSLGEKDQNESN